MSYNQASLPSNATRGHAMGLPARADSMRAAHAQALAANAPVAVLAVEARLPRALAGDEALRQRAVRALFELVRNLPRTDGLIATQGPDAIVALAPGRSLEQARDLGAELVARSFALDVEGLDPSLGLAPCVGLAVADARHPHTLETLLAVAVEGASVARARGGACCTHTELYALCAERIAREGAGNLSAFFSGSPSSGFVVPPRPESLGPPATKAPTVSSSESKAAEAEPRAALPSAGRAPAATGPDEIERLERRIAKLVAQLEDTQRKMARLERSKGVDDGVASIYRDVQGLDEGDEQFGMKNELMEAILQANLELRACMQAQSEASA